MSNTRILWLEDETATVTAGHRLAHAVKDAGADRGLVVFLHGTLGAGKTTFSRGFIRGLGHEGAVKSPTYTLVEPYEYLRPAVWHFDLYRLGDPEELEFMGIRDYLAPGNVCLIEWPERGQGILPVPDMELTLTPQQGGRSLGVDSHSDAGRILLGRWLEHMKVTVQEPRTEPRTDQE